MENATDFIDGKFEEQDQFQYSPPTYVNGLPWLLTITLNDRIVPKKLEFVVLCTGGRNGIFILLYLNRVMPNLKWSFPRIVVCFFGIMRFEFGTCLARIEFFLFQDHGYRGPERGLKISGSEKNLDVRTRLFNGNKPSGFSGYLVFPGPFRFLGRFMA